MASRAQSHDVAGDPTRFDAWLRMGHELIFLVFRMPNSKKRLCVTQH
jgi:hypothetical protein